MYKNEVLSSESSLMDDQILPIECHGSRSLVDLRDFRTALLPSARLLPIDFGTRRPPPPIQCCIFCTGPIHLAVSSRHVDLPVNMSDHVSVPT